MDAYNGKYYLHGQEEQPATLLFLKDRISIGLRDPDGNPLVVYWSYDQIVRENYWKNGKGIVRTTGYPAQVIEVEEKEFIQTLEDIFRQRERSWLSRAMNKNVMGIVKVMAVFFGALIAAYIWLVPFLAERLARRVPVAYEESLGN